jgi:hypothetical protein
MEGKLLFQDLGDKRFLCLQILRDRLYKSEFEDDYCPLISKRYDEAELKLRGNLNKLYSRNSFDNYDPLTCWSNGPFSVKTDRVIRAVGKRGQGRLNNLKVEHNFFYATNNGLLMPKALESLANQNGLNFYDNVNIAGLIEVVKTYQPISIDCDSICSNNFAENRLKREYLFEKAKNMRRVSAKKCYQNYEDILSEIVNDNNNNTHLDIYSDAEIINGDNIQGDCTIIKEITPAPSFDTTLALN